MRLSIPFFLLMAIIFFSGCVNMYSDAIRENCMDLSKYPSPYYQSECLLKKSHYFAAFGDPNSALAQCDAIKGLISQNLLGTTSNWIGINHEVEMFNTCVEDTAVQSLDESYCDRKIYPNVFASLQSIFDAIPTPITPGDADASYVSSCKDKVRFANQRANSLPNLMSNFTYLMTVPPSEIKKAGR
jgi:hypothetical protein